MTDAKAHIEAMQRRLDKMAAREEQLVEALNEALSRADRRLLDDVRAMTLEHEARRTIILTELQSLATRIGTFPATAKPVETIEYEVAETADNDTEAKPAAGASPPADTETAKGGDWRTATRRIAEELSLAVNGAPATYGGDPGTA